MRILLTALLFLFTLPALAQTPPVPSQHPVREMERRLKDEEKAKADLEKDLKILQSDIESGKKSLVDLAKDIKKNEDELTTLEVRLKGLQAEQDEIQERLGVDRDSMADLILALQRIRRVPPEALLARPGAPLETAQSAMLLQTILPELYGRAEGLKKDLTRLGEIVDAVEKDKAALTTKTVALSQKQKEMTAMLDARQKEYRRAQSDVAQRESEIKQISSRAGGLKDLIEELGRREKERRTAAVSAAASTTSARAARPPRRDSMPKAGTGQLPVSGIVRARYGERDEIGARLEGIRIEARNGALVVSPMGGIVRYSGDFRNYGNMVIIEHPGNYHSLVAGLARIDTVVGQSVAAGEPLGTLGGSSGVKPALYYELRLNGQPINPARKIGDLG